MAFNRRGSVVKRDGRTGKAAEREMARMQAGQPEKGAVNRMPPSPEEFHKIYNEGRKHPAGMEAKDEHASQFREDQQAKGYHNDCKGWVRGQGPVEGGLHPHFDHGKLDINNVPPKPARGLEASGRDIAKSPFSAAHKTWSE